MRVFIDTNIYLGFIRSSDESPDSLLELVKLINEDNVSLIFPKITYEEFVRNVPNVEVGYIKEIEQNLPRVPKLSTSLKHKQLGEKFEKLCKDYEKELEKLKETYLTSVDKIVSRISEDIRPKAINKESEPDLIDKAQQRKLLGNPPGKKEHMGDELEWEILLKYFFDEDLTVITNDGDWKNAVKPEELNPLLIDEWKNHSNKKLTLYTTLGEFINVLTGESKITKEEIEEEQKETSIAGRNTLDRSNLSSSATVFNPFPSLSVTAVPTNFIDVFNPELIDTSCLKNLSEIDISAYPRTSSKK